VGTIRHEVVIVPEVRVALVTIILAASSAFALPASIATAAAKNPTPAQIQSAVGSAERSRSLWATVHICDTKRFPNTIGVRGQMPALGFSSSMFMNLQIEFFNKTKKQFLPIPKASMKIPLGKVTTGLQQGGATFAFKRHTGLLSATIQFEWVRGGKVLGSTTRRTTGGHKGADFGDPPHFSAPQCRIR
jgi:hypothetical protein